MWHGKFLVNCDSLTLKVVGFLTESATSERLHIVCTDTSTPIDSSGTDYTIGRRHLPKSFGRFSSAGRHRTDPTSFYFAQKRNHYNSSRSEAANPITTAAATSAWFPQLSVKCGKLNSSLSRQRCFWEGNSHNFAIVGEPKDFRSSLCLLLSL